MRMYIHIHIHIHTRIHKHTRRHINIQVAEANAIPLNDGQIPFCFFYSFCYIQVAEANAIPLDDDHIKWIIERWAPQYVLKTQENIIYMRFFSHHVRNTIEWRSNQVEYWAVSPIYIYNIYIYVYIYIYIYIYIYTYIYVAGTRAWSMASMFWNLFKNIQNTHTHKRTYMAGTRASSMLGMIYFLFFLF
jgi:hypothetical protein